MGPKKRSDLLVRRVKIDTCVSILASKPERWSKATREGRETGAVGMNEVNVAAEAGKTR